LFQRLNVGTNAAADAGDDNDDKAINMGLLQRFTSTTFCTLCSLTGDAVWNTNLDLAVMIENWYPKSAPSLRATF